MNKKGAELTIGTIVIIVLALIVLVVLVLGFTGGWGNLWTRITSYFGGANVDSVVQACQVACSTESKNDYCTRTRTLKFEDKDEKLRTVKLSCEGLENKNGKDVKDIEGENVLLPSVELSCDLDCPPGSDQEKYSS